jgi:RNA polymerase primary sigma factor
MSETLQYQSRGPDDLLDRREPARVSEAGQIDDPLRIYLMQMGKIPLLSRQEEVGLAMRVELARRRFRRTVLATDLGLRTQFLQATFAKLKEISARMDELGPQITALDGSAGSEDRRAKLRNELCRLMRTTRESPATLRRRIARATAFLAEYKAAKDSLSAGNLRLVVSIAKRYRNRGLSFLDLIQEGNTGLMRAVDKFEWRRGFRFSTFATWWIRQAITRAVADHGRTIRLPVHAIETMSKVRGEHRRLFLRNGSEPRLEETATAVDMSPGKLACICRADREPLSLNQSVGGHDGASFGDYVRDHREDDPLAEMNRQMLKSRIADVLESLDYRQREILRLRYGLADGCRHTLKEVGKVFSLTRERVRQIEKNALRALRHPTCAWKLAGFLEGRVFETADDVPYGRRPSSVAASATEPRDIWQTTSADSALTVGTE